MAAIQLNFTLRTSSNCKTVHLLGSWDGYRGQLPLSKDSSKSGGWKGTFRFQGTVLKQGQRYWYYYIVDGYHVSHDPARDSVTEPTTGRKLNVLDIPMNKGSTSQNPAPAPTKSTREAARHSRRTSTNCAKGRPLSVSDIQSPRPRKPTETRNIRHEKFNNPTLDQLSAKFASYQIDDDEEEEEDSEVDSESDSDVSVPSLTSQSSRSSGGSGASSPSSVSSSSSCCTCERYGITRGGSRVKLDCGGRRCGYSDSSECSSDSDGDYRRGTTRRNGIVVRH